MTPLTGPRRNRTQQLRLAQMRAVPEMENVIASAIVLIFIVLVILAVCL
jgi:hypothetical protein